MTGTVVIPAFNRPEMLRRAVESVLAQTRARFELVVVDDASEADLSAVRKLVEQAGHRWMRLEENRGPAAARNAGVAATTGQWIAFLDSDDRWLTEKLERQLAWHADHPGIVISQSEEIWIRNGVRINKPAHLRQPETGRIFEACTVRCSVSPSGVMLTREWWDRSGKFDERYRVCEDYELWLRIALDQEVGLVPGNLVEKYGGHADQISRNFPAMDRLRVNALLELLASGIPEHEAAIAAAEAGKKARILAVGAEKRDLPEANFYRRIEAWAKSGADTARLEPLIVDLNRFCFQAAGS